MSSSVTVNLPVAEGGGVELSESSDGTFSASRTIPITGILSAEVGIDWNPSDNALTFSVGPQVGVPTIAAGLLQVQSTVTLTGGGLTTTLECQTTMVIGGGLVTGTASCADTLYQGLNLMSGGTLGLFTGPNIQNSESNNNLPSGDLSGSDVGNFQRALDGWQDGLNAPATAIIVNYAAAGSSAAPAATEVGGDGDNLNVADLANINGGNVGEFTLVGGISSSLTGGVAPVVIAALGDGDYVTAGQNAFVSVEGANFNVYASGSTIYIGNSLGGSINGSGATINTGASDTVAVNGNDNTVKAGDLNYIALNNTGNVVEGTAGAGSDTSQSTVVMNAGGNTANMAQGSVFVADSVGLDVNGSGTTINTGARDTLNVNGNGNTVKAGDLNYIALNNTGNVVEGTAGAGSDTSQSTVVINASGNVVNDSQGFVATTDGIAATVNGISTTIQAGASDNITANGVAVAELPGSRTQETILDTNGAVSEQMTTNQDGSWSDHLWDPQGQYGWGEEQFVHATDGTLAEQTVRYFNGTNTTTYWDVSNQTNWSEDIKTYAGTYLKEDMLLNHDGTEAVTFYGTDPGSPQEDRTYTYRSWNTVISPSNPWLTTNTGEILTNAGQLIYADYGGHNFLASTDWTGGNLGTPMAGDDLPAALTFNTNSLSFNSLDTLNDVLSPIDFFNPLQSDPLSEYTEPLTPESYDDPSINSWYDSSFSILPFNDPLSEDLAADDFFEDPIVLNLNGQSVGTTSAATNGVLFDMRGQGVQQSTGWVTAGEGFLVIDKEGTGQITSSHDMISDLNELSTFDTNHDGRVAADDEQFAELRVWVPWSAGGSGALSTLTQLGISAINLDGVSVDQGDNGNTIKSTFSFSYADGATGQGADVNFALGSNTGQATTDALVQAMATFGGAAPASAPPTYQLSQSSDATLAAQH